MKKNKYKIQIQKFYIKIESANDQLINIEINEDGLNKFKGSINLKDIYSQISVFDEYKMEEYFNLINYLKEDNFIISKESNQYKLEILCQVLKKIKKLSINLSPANESICVLLKHLWQIQKKQEDRIKQLKSLLNELQTEYEDIKIKKRKN